MLSAGNKCLRSFLSEDSLDDSEEKNVDIINNPFIDSMVDRDNLLKAVEQIAEGEKFATVVLHAKEGTDTGYHSSRFALMMMAEQLRQWGLLSSLMSVLTRVRW